MRLTPSPLVAKLSGKAGAAVALSRPGQIVVKGHNPTPRNPKSGSQQTVRASFKFLAIVEARLRSQAADAWAVAASRTGDLPNNIFLKTNWQSQYAAFFNSFTPDNPLVVNVQARDAINITANGARIRWWWTDTDPDDKVWTTTYPRLHPTDPLAVTPDMGYPQQTIAAPSAVSVHYVDVGALLPETDYRTFCITEDHETGEYGGAMFQDFTTTA